QGNYVLVWIEADASGRRVVARLFSPQGLPRGPKLQVSATGEAFAFPTVAMNAEGSFMVAWFSSQFTARAQLFAPGGARIGSEIQVTEPTATDSVDALLVGIDRQGRSVIVRSSLGGIFLRRFSSQGALLAPEALVVKTWTQVALAMQPDGSFTLIWAGFDLLGRRF